MQTSKCELMICSSTFAWQLGHSTNRRLFVLDLDCNKFSNAFLFAADMTNCRSRHVLNVIEYNVVVHLMLLFMCTHTVTGGKEASGVQSPYGGHVMTTTYSEARSYDIHLRRLHYECYILRTLSITSTDDKRSGVVLNENSIHHCLLNNGAAPSQHCNRRPEQRQVNRLRDRTPRGARGAH